MKSSSHAGTANTMSTLLRPRGPILAAALLLLSGCASVGRDYERPQLELPAEWSGAEADPHEVEQELEGQWWRRFDAPRLDELVQRALAHNRELGGALARLERARALRSGARADELPSVTGRGAYEHRRESSNTPFGAFIPRTNIHTLALDAAWEPDLWGRVRRSVEAADRELAASEHDVRAVGVAVAAEVARNYVELGSVRQRLRIAQANVELQERTLALVRSRAEAGLVGPRDVAQATASVEATRARLPQLRASASIAAHRLAVLVGAEPGALEQELADIDTTPRTPPSLVMGVPADLLRRRPDIAAAEQRLAAEVARIGIQESELYPRLVLGGTLGLSSNGSADLLDSDSDFLGLGPSLSWKIFAGGRIRAAIRAQEARVVEAQLAWEDGVMRALEEAENALVSFVLEQERRRTLEGAATQARRAVELAQTQYREGLTDFQAVVDSQRVVAGLEDELAQSDSAVTGFAIALYKALGGRFDSLESRLTAAR